MASVTRHGQYSRQWNDFLHFILTWWDSYIYIKRTPGSRQIGDFARAKDTLSVIIVEIDTRIYKTYPELDLTIVPQLSERYYEFNL